MTSFWLLSIPILILTFSQIYIIGRYVSNRYGIFVANEYAQYALGFSVYFALTFLVLVPFQLLNSPIQLSTIVFIVKDFLLISLIIVMRDSWRHLIKWRFIPITIAGSSLIVVFFEFVIRLYVDEIEDLDTHQLQTWITYTNIIGDIGSFDQSYVESYYSGFLAATIVFTSITSIYIHLSRGTRYLDPLIGLILAFLFLTIFSHGKPLWISGGEYLVLFSMIYVIQIFTYSRRRYGTLFGATVVAAWSFDPSVYFAALALAFTMGMIYQITNKRRPAFFWIQLMAPFIPLSSFLLFPISQTWTIIMVVVSIIVYVLALVVVNVQFISKFSRMARTVKYVMPITTIMVVTALGIYSFVANEVKFSDLFLSDHALFANVFESDLWSYVQWILYCLTFIGLIIWAIHVYLNKKSLIRTRITFAVSLGLFIIAYNPLLNASLSAFNIEEAFYALQFVAVSPLIISSTSIIRTAQLKMATSRH